MVHFEYMIKNFNKLFKKFILNTTSIVLFKTKIYIYLRNQGSYSQLKLN